MNKSKTVAVQQIRRLRAKPFYPTADIENGEKSNPGEKELARTLYTYAQSDFHMEQVINAATIRRFGDNGQDRCPSTSDIWQLCGEINPAPATKAIVVNQNCEECAGTGFMIVHFPHGITGAAFCARGCSVSGYQFHHDGMSRKAISSWYRDEQDGAAERRQAFIKRGSKVLKAPKITDDQIAQLRQRQDAARTSPI
jgi:hypothetical protein